MEAAVVYARSDLNLSVCCPTTLYPLCAKDLNCYKYDIYFLKKVLCVLKEENTSLAVSK